jgi:hypothetical protein
MVPIVDHLLPLDTSADPVATKKMMKELLNGIYGQFADIHPEHEELRVIRKVMNLGGDICGVAVVERFHQLQDDLFPRIRWTNQVGKKGLESFAHMFKAPPGVLNPLLTATKKK